MADPLNLNSHLNYLVTSKEYEVYLENENEKNEKRVSELED